MLVLVAAGCVFTWLSTDVGKEWMPHAATSAFAIAITITVVERIVRREREKQLKPAVRFARRRIRRALGRLLELVAAMTVASTVDYQESLSSSFGYIDTWATNVQYLNFNAETVSGQRWSEAVLTETRYIGELLREAQAMLANFPELLGRPVLEQVELLLDNPVFIFFSADWIGSVRKRAIAQGRCASNMPYLALGGNDETMADLRESFATAIRGLFDAFLRLTPEDAEDAAKFVEVREYLYPGWVNEGSGRFDGQAADACIPTFRKTVEDRFTVGPPA